jgi:enterochelin esterase-like enzyme
MRLKRARTGFLPLFFCFAASGVLLAQADNAALTYGNYRKIHSKVLGEDRTLLIRLPADYDKSGKAYPVLYKLDGDKEISLQTFSTLDYLVDMTDKVPDHIVVGIENTDRTRDMNPDRGAVNFIQFIKTELILFIDKNYRTSGFKILGGESASSMFALYSFLKEPALFDAYLLSSFGLYNESQAAYFTNELGKNQYLKKVGKKYICGQWEKGRIRSRWLDHEKRSAIFGVSQADGPCIGTDKKCLLRRRRARPLSLHLRRA